MHRLLVIQNSENGGDGFRNLGGSGQVPTILSLSNKSRLS